MTYDICFQLRGDAVPSRVFKVVKTEKAAWAAARKVVLQPGVMNVTIDCEDGRTIYDSRRDDIFTILPPC